MKDVYEVSDLGLSAALATAGVMLVSVDKANPRRAIFIFQNSIELEDVIAGYWDGSLSLPAQQYFETLKRMKSRLYT